MTDAFAGLLFLRHRIPEFRTFERIRYPAAAPTNPLHHGHLAHAPSLRGCAASASAMTRSYAEMAASANSGAPEQSSWMRQTASSASLIARSRLAALTSAFAASYSASAAAMEAI